MENIIYRVICIIIGYGFGLFQTAYIYGKLNNIDIRDFGSGNAGTFTDLQNYLNAGGNITLSGNFTYSGESGLAGGITIPTTVTKIDGQGNVIIDGNKI